MNRVIRALWVQLETRAIGVLQVIMVKRVNMVIGE